MLNRREFAGAGLAGLGSLFFPRESKSEDELVHEGLTHVEMTERVFMHENQVVCSCLPHPRSIIPAPSSTATVYGEDTILHVKNMCGWKDYTIDISDPDNKIIQFNRSYKKPFHYVRQNERWVKL